MAECGRCQGTRLDKHGRCLDCRNVRQKAKYRTWAGWCAFALSQCRGRARKRGHPCTITKDDLLAVVPPDGCCPVFGVQLVLGSPRDESRDDSASVDRIVSTEGYVPGNVLIVSNKANRAKCNLTVEEMGRLYGFYRSL